MCRDSDGLHEFERPSEEGKPMPGTLCTCRAMRWYTPDEQVRTGQNFGPTAAEAIRRALRVTR
jgi:hypothetical protein